MPLFCFSVYTIVCRVLQNNLIGWIVCVPANFSSRKANFAQNIPRPSGYDHILSPVSGSSKQICNFRPNASAISCKSVSVGSSPTWGAKKPGRKTRSFCIPRRNLINMSFQRTASVRALPGSNPSATSVGAAGIAGASALCLRSGRFLLCRTAHRAAASFAPLGSTKTGSGLNCFAGTLF